MTTAYLDAFSGISGDMTIGAMLDAGLSITFLRRELKKLGLDGYSLSATKVKYQGITATAFGVKETKKHKSRDWAAIKKLIERSSLSPDVKRTATDIFLRIAKAEAAVHGTSVEKVHFHEVGAVDSIIDVVGAAIGLEKLGIKRLVCSPLPTGGGLVNTSHGMMPVPAPATLRILKGAPLKTDDYPMELVTPTGAAIAAGADAFGPMPSMVVKSIGYGAGSKQRDDKVPNLLRLVIGEGGAVGKPLTVVEANIDDATPEELAHLQATAMDKGALDCWVTPVMMKKGRQAFTLSILCQPEKADGFRRLVLEESPTLGVRQYAVERFELSRRTEKVKTKYGVVRVKVSVTPSGRERRKPEFDDVSRLAKKHGVSFKTVFSATRTGGSGRSR